MSSQETFLGIFPDGMKLCSDFPGGSSEMVVVQEPGLFLTTLYFQCFED